MNRGDWNDDNARGLAFASVGAWNDAVDAFSVAAAAVEPSDSVASHEALALVLNNLAHACYRAQRVDESILYAQRACAMRVALVGEDALAVARVRADLAVMLGASGRGQEAMQLIDRAIASIDRHVGDEDLRLATVLENAARLSMAAAQPSSAEPYLLRLHALLAAHEQPTDVAEALLARVASFRASAHDIQAALTPVRGADAVVSEEEYLLDETLADAPIAEALITEAPVVDEPIVDESVVDEPVVEAVAADAPAVDEPLAEEPVVDAQVVEASVGELPVGELPVGELPVGELPVVDATVVEIETPIPVVLETLSASGGMSAIAFIDYVEDASEPSAHEATDDDDLSTDDAVPSIELSMIEIAPLESIALDLVDTEARMSPDDIFGDTTLELIDDPLAAASVFTPTHSAAAAPAPSARADILGFQIEYGTPSEETMNALADSIVAPPTSVRVHTPADESVSYAIMAPAPLSTVIATPQVNATSAEPPAPSAAPSLHRSMPPADELSRDRAKKVRAGRAHAPKSQAGIAISATVTATVSAVAAWLALRTQ